MRFLFVSVLACSCIWVRLPAQEYVLLGSATTGVAGCVLLTADEPYQEGVAWAADPVDLRGPLRLGYDLFLGKSDTLGADGICFVLQADPRGTQAYGTFGECLGYGRWSEYSSSPHIAPSLAVEFDTYENPNQNDPAADHLALHVGGLISHWVTPATPVAELEDGRKHAFDFMYDPTSHRVRVWLDSQPVIDLTLDLTQVFGPQTRLYWGFTGSTGRKHNLQFFCPRPSQVALE